MIMTTDIFWVDYPVVFSILFYKRNPGATRQSVAKKKKIHLKKEQLLRLNVPNALKSTKNLKNIK